jgi:hypothetical protein
MTLQLGHLREPSTDERRARISPDDDPERQAITPVLIVEVPSVVLDVLQVAPRPALEAAVSLPARQSALAAQPEDWNAGPSAWDARPVQPHRIDALSLLVVAAVGALVPGLIARVIFGHTAPGLVCFMIAFTVGGALACWLGLRTPAPRRVELERGVLFRDVYGLKGRFVAGACVDGLTRGTPVAIGQNPSAEVCLYANGREYPLARNDLDRVRSVMRPAGDVR